MSGLRIVEVDVHDRAAFDAWHHVYDVAERHGREEFATPWTIEEVRALMQGAGIRASYGAWNGLLDGEVVAVGWMRTGLLDNLDRAEVAVHVLPAHRRRGHGRALAAHLERVARARGRSVLVGEVSFAYDAGPAGAGEDGPEFARAVGYDLALGDVQRMLELPVDDALLDRLAAGAAPYHTAYTLRSWAGPVPEELLEGWARLTASLVTEAPTGELDVEPEAVSPEAVREGEALSARQGRTRWNTVALTADGEVVAYSDLATTVHEPERAYQWGTLVRRDHRGHRLGVAVKVANLRLLQAEGPATLRTMVTWNAEVNGPMIAVNELLGFTPVARLGEFQKRIG
jgi:GNAT superfamily N-acetyltransferase